MWQSVVTYTSDLQTLPFVTVTDTALLLPPSLLLRLYACMPMSAPAPVPASAYVYAPVCMRLRLPLRLYACCFRDVVGELKGFRPDKIPLSEIISRVGGQRQFDAAVLETILLRAMSDVSVGVDRQTG